MPHIDCAVFESWGDVLSFSLSLSEGLSGCHMTELKCLEFSTRFDFSVVSVTSCVTMS